MTEARRDILIALGIVAGVFVVYGLTAPAGLIGSDQGEYATLAASPGVAHPPGYPLYLMYLRAVCPLPGLSVVHSTGVATALLGALAMGLNFIALRAWNFHRIAAAGAVLLFAFEYTVWTAHSHAEALALASLVVPGIFWASAPDTLSGARRGAMLGLLAGLGLAAHQTLVLIAPLGLWAYWQAWKESESIARLLVSSLFALLVGLSPYLYLLLTPAECVRCFSWGNPASLGDLIDHFLRVDFGTTQLTAKGARDPIAHWSAFGARLAEGSYGIFPLLALAGTRVLWSKSRALFFTLAAALAVSILAFIGTFNTSMSEMVATTTARFYLVPIWFAVPFVAAALSLDIVSMKARAIVVTACCAGLLTLNGPKIVGYHSGVIDHWVQDTLKSLPDGAIVVGTGDHRTLAFAYSQFVEGTRPDVDYVDGMLLAYPWYLERLESRLARTDLPRTTEEGIPIVEITGLLLESGRPVFLVDFHTPDLRKFPNYPYGTLIRLASPGAALPSPPEVATKNAEIFGEFDLQSAPQGITNPWEVDLLRYYRRPWEVLSKAFARSGSKQAADQAENFAAVYEPKTER